MILDEGLKAVTFCPIVTGVSNGGQKLLRGRPRRTDTVFLEDPVGIVG